MKKILALVLACVMLASMFTVNAFAETLDFKTPTSIGDGVPSFDPTAQTGDVNVKVTAVTHNYCVDLLYTDTTITLPGITWDVHAMKYNVNEAEKTTFEANNKKTFTVTNYSDLSVNVAFTVNDLAKDANDDAINFAITGGTVAAVENVGTGNGTAVAENFELTITCDNYVTAAKKYAETGTANVKVATYTVTITQ